MKKSVKRPDSLRVIICAVWLVFCLPVFGLAQDRLPVCEDALLKGHIEEAVSCFEKVLPGHPEQARILSNIGRAYFHLGHYGKSEEMISEALRLKPQEPWIQCWSTVYLGRIQAMRNQHETAAQTLRLAAEGPGTDNCVKDAHEHLAYLKALLFALKDMNGQFSTPCCTIRYPADVFKKEEISMLAEDTQKYFDRIQRLFFLLPEDVSISIYIFPASFKYDLWEGREVIARNLRNQIFLAYDGKEDTQFLEHELVHVMTAGFFRHDTLPPLITEGLAEYVNANPWGIPQDAWVREFQRSGDFIPVSRLIDARIFRAANPVISYTEAGSFVKFLVGQYGLEPLRELLKQGGSWESVYGKSISELEEEWLGRISHMEISSDNAELIAYRVWMGVFYQNQRMYKKRLPWAGITYEIKGKNVILNSVTPLSPAEKAGLLNGDRVIMMDAITVNPENSWKLAGIVHRKQINDTVSFVIERNGEQKAFKVLLERELH
jgi:tetratricopeptide (TPR) repeat protein